MPSGKFYLIRALLNVKLYFNTRMHKGREWIKVIGICNSYTMVVRDYR